MGKVREENEVARWEMQEGSKVARLGGGRALRWEGRRFPVLFMGGQCRVSPRFHLFVSDVNQGKE